jgi:hypothetical protein
MQWGISFHAFQLEINDQTASVTLPDYLNIHITKSEEIANDDLTQFLTVERDHMFATTPEKDKVFHNPISHHNWEGMWKANLSKYQCSKYQKSHTLIPNQPNLDLFHVLWVERRIGTVRKVKKFELA